MNKSEALKKRLRTELAQELENTWEVSDDEVLEIIDRLLLKESKSTYLAPLSVWKSFAWNYSVPCGKWMFWKNSWKMTVLLKSW